MARSRRSAERSELSLSPHHAFAWPNDRSLSMADVTHRKAGFWAIDTANPNAWSTGSDYMLRTSADIVLTQEVKLPGGYPAVAAEQAARSKKWSLTVEPCLITAAGGKSAGTAVATRSFIGMSVPAPVAAMQHLHATDRFCMRRVAAMTKGGVHMGSIYCHSMVGQGGITAKCNLDLLESVGSTILQLKGLWCIGGDWNCTPQELRDTGWIKRINGVIHAPEAETCNGKVYDFFVVAAGLSDHIQGAFTIGDAGFHPHSPCRLVIRGVPRKVMVTMLQAPTSLPAILPHGPMEEEAATLDPVEQSGKPIDERYAELANRTTAKLGKLIGKDLDGTRSSNEWADGPKFVWRNVADPKATTRPGRRRCPGRGSDRSRG